MRGAAGGYQLAKPPQDITLADVISAMEGSPPALRSEAIHRSAASRVLDEAWREVSAVEQEMLSNMTFAELTERARRRGSDVLHLSRSHHLFGARATPRNRYLHIAMRAEDQ